MDAHHEHRPLCYCSNCTSHRRDVIERATRNRLPNAPELERGRLTKLVLFAETMRDLGVELSGYHKKFAHHGKYQDCPCATALAIRRIEGALENVRATS